MKKSIVKLFFLCLLTLIVGITIVKSDIVESQALSLQNLFVLNAAQAEGSGGSSVDCESCWRDCFFGCITKYRCNVITPCQEIMAKASCSESVSGKCNPNDQC